MRLHEFFKDPIDLNEVLTTKIPEPDWKKTKDGYEAIVNIDQFQYRIELQEMEYTLNGVKYPYLNLAFQRYLNGTYVTDTTHDTKQASKVIGAIGNSLGDFIEKLKPDAIMFGSTDPVNTKARMRIYSFIADRFLKHYGRVKTFKMEKGEAMVVYNKNIGAKIMPLLKHIQQKQSQK